MSAGCPSGPTYCALPPIRAIAIAALTAQPPGTPSNSLVMHMPPGGGNSWTRNTMSCTAMPTHRIAGALEPGPLEDGTVALHPTSDYVMCVGDRWLTGET